MGKVEKSLAHAHTLELHNLDLLSPCLDVCYKYHALMYLYL